ncbi:hypothetical protein PR202_ga01856 [Eleusine coracana subsp. coracana]|uniref:PhoD-like phosphatase metallophosphatase domain-containing protein n=1 Tax=Eleusine coracana subsp. coracana TaxID=191504 RepID=A0AAV5BGA9_ELECO|nr:hypothetical protein PR202_ga01169 [Eleusine coracana subsp. coracana]GJM86038.1 hypothetical protein PR202_ga01856 [Eleusine coracana subsp. coracana]
MQSRKNIHRERHAALRSLQALSSLSRVNRGWKELPPIRIAVAASSWCMARCLGEHKSAVGLLPGTPPFHLSAVASFLLSLSGSLASLRFSFAFILAASRDMTTVIEARSQTVGERDEGDAMRPLLADRMRRTGTEVRRFRRKREERRVGTLEEGEEIRQRGLIPSNRTVEIDLTIIIVHYNLQVIGTWDDHDYGLNDAGKELNGKLFTQRLLLDFLDEAQDSPRYIHRNTTRKQAGVYTSYMFGPEGKRVKVNLLCLDSLNISKYMEVYDSTELQVILLDTRYHRDPLLSDGTILGDPQWQWLERELHGPQSEITIIGSSIQVVSNLSGTTGPLFYVESWGRFPRERERLFRLIDSSKRNGVIFISGDVHFGEIARFDCGAQYPLYDVTSSGLTQSVEHSVPAVFGPLMRFLALVTPTTMRVLSPNCRYKSCSYGQPNFGAIEIDWDAVPHQIKLELRDVQGHFVHRVEFPISELQPSDVNAAKKQAHGIQRHCTLETELPWFTRYRLALLFFSITAGFFIAVVLLVFTCLSVGKKCKRE